MKELKILKDLVSIRSDNDEKKVLSYIEETLKGKVEEIKYVKSDNGKENIMIGINTKLKDIEPVVLSGHIDTVNADEKEYLTNPYDLIIKEGKAYGLGVIDMKCFTSSVIDLIDKLKNYNYPIVLALTTDEETQLKGIESIIENLKENNIKPKFTIIGEPTNMKVNNISNGCFEYKVEVYGKSCHSSTPQNGINSICILARLITYIEELSNNYDDLVMNSNLISGGTIINRIPDYATMSFDIRTTNIDNYKEVINFIESEIKELEKEYKTIIKITKELEIPPLSCKNKMNIESLCSSLNLEIENFSGGCEAGYYENYSGDAILFGVGDLSLAHKPNEYMLIEDYEKYNEIFLNLLDKVGQIYY